jgi:hypothetical protein
MIFAFMVGCVALTIAGAVAFLRQDDVIGDDPPIVALLASIAGVVAALFAGLIVSAYLDYARFDATAGCKAQRMDALPKPYSVEVVCTPYPTRQDTTTINANVK